MTEPYASGPAASRGSAQRRHVTCLRLALHLGEPRVQLPKRRPASWYDPGRFWSGDRIDLVPPFALAGKVALGSSA